MMNKYRVKASFIRFILLGSSVFLFLVYNTVLGVIPAHEREALIALYNSANGDHWLNKTGWKTPPLAADGFALPGTENTWYGVTCNFTNTTVQEINLKYNNLVGSLPPELGNLVNLETLWLSGAFTGSIPPELGNLTRLKYLGLYGDLSGSIPPQLGNMTDLEYLNLSWNSLSGSIPPELGNLTNLQRLLIENCLITGSIPPQLGNLTNLLYLSLSGNNLSGIIPSTLGNLTNLRHLVLCYNNLSGSIPPELGNLTSADELHLEHNRLSGTIPPEIGNMTNLMFLFLNGNRLCGVIPDTLQNLVNLGWGWTFYQGINICFNALHTENQELRQFIYQHSDWWCDWETNQTLPPGRISAHPISLNSIELEWRTIAYQENAGCYRVFYSTSADGPFQYFGKTEDKYASSMTIDGLETDTTYYFKIKTRTRPHKNNPNTVDSDFSEVVSAATFSAEIIPISGIITCNGARLAGVALTLSNNGGTFTTDADGYYIAVVRPGWSGTITPTKKNYRFTPASRSYTKINYEKIDQDFEAVQRSTITNRHTND